MHARKGITAPQKFPPPLPSPPDKAFFLLHRSSLSSSLSSSSSSILSPSTVLLYTYTMYYVHLHRKGAAAAVVGAGRSSAEGKDSSSDDFLGPRPVLQTTPSKACRASWSAIIFSSFAYFFPSSCVHTHTHTPSGRKRGRRGVQSQEESRGGSSCVRVYVCV